MKRKWSPPSAVVVMFLLAGSGGPLQAQEDAKTQALRLLEATGVKGGLCVLAGCGDARLAAELARGRAMLVQALVLDAGAVEQARQHLRGGDLYGQVSVQALSAGRMPYADDMVNLLLVEDMQGIRKAGSSVPELLRAVSPNGWLALSGPVESRLEAELSAAGLDASKAVKAGGWLLLRKPRPKEMDEWTHCGHDASNNNVSRDAAIGPLGGLRWIAGPYWTRDHWDKHSTWAMVSGGGKIYYLTWNVPENFDRTPTDAPRHTVILARDAYNGLRLWARPFPAPGYVAPDPDKVRLLDGKAFKQATWFGYRSVFRSYGELLVAAGARLYAVLDGEVTALDADTGQTLLTYEKGASPGSLAVHDDALILAGPDAVRCYGLAAGEPRWRLPLASESAVVGQERVFVLGGKKARTLTCIDLAGGRKQWQVPVLTGENFQYYFYHQGVLAFVGGKQAYHMTVYSAEDGRKLWETQDVQRGGVFGIEALIWVRRAAKRGPEAARPETFVVGLDPQTGKETGRRVPVGRYAGFGCYRSVDMANYIVGTRPLNLIRRSDGKVFEFRGARHHCDVGVVPANGLMYSGPHPCTCTQEAIRGFIALAPGKEAHEKANPAAEARRLEKGPAYGQAPPATPGDPGADWPTYRHDPQRSGGSASPLPAGARLLWEAALEGPGPLEAPLRADWKANPTGLDGLTPPVVAGELVFVCTVNSHRLLALEAATGRQRWSFTAGGRLYLPPTIHHGLCLAGSADGWVYCLRASDGQLLWRYRAAPADEQIIAYGQLESKWPVAGGVLVENGVAYCAAGRNSTLDGGIHAHAIDPATGKGLWSNRFATGAMCDQLVSNGRKIFMANTTRQDRGVAFDPVGQSNAAPALPCLTGDGSMGWTLDRTWLRITKLGYPWEQRPPQPQPIRGPDPLAKARSDGKCQMHSFRGCPGILVAGRTDHQRVFAYRLGAEQTWGKGAGTAGSQLLAREGDQVCWSLEFADPVLVDALAVAGDTLLAAGRCDRYQSARDGFLWLISTAEGKRLGEFKLPAPPVCEGLAAAGGRLFVATVDGRLLCLGTR